MVRFALLVSIGLLCCAMTGCAVESPLSVRRVWVDCNTLNQPAFFYDKISHLPPESPRAKEMRWMYNRGPHEIGPYSLIPSSRQMVPLQGGPVCKPPEKNPQVPAPRDGPKLPPLPSGQSSPPMLQDGPVAGRPPRTADASGTWRFIR